MISTCEKKATVTAASPRGRRWTWVFVTLWALGIGGWFGFLYWYSNAPGPEGPAPVNWPKGATIAPSTDRFTLVMFIHPQCPCTNASLEELVRIITHCGDRADFHCLFVRPSGLPEGWEKSSLWRDAAAIGQIRLTVDADGVEARRFGATTSGHVRLYDRAGKLVFDGGITGARSHAGDNAGANAVTEWLRTGHSDCSKSFVFGCSLF